MSDHLVKRSSVKMLPKKRKKKDGEIPVLTNEVKNNPVHLKQMPGSSLSDIKQIEMGQKHVVEVLVDDVAANTEADIKANNINNNQDEVLVPLPLEDKFDAVRGITQLDVNLGCFINERSQVFICSWHHCLQA